MQASKPLDELTSRAPIRAREAETATDEAECPSAPFLSFGGRLRRKRMQSDNRKPPKVERLPASNSASCRSQSSCSSEQPPALRQGLFLPRILVLEKRM